MRLDYVSYAVAIVLFIVTLTAVVYLTATQQQVWVVTTVVIGIAFIGLGYTQRPRPATPTVTTSVPPPPPSQPQQQQEQQQQVPEVTAVPAQSIVTDVVKLEEVKPVVQPLQSPVGVLTDIKGIGEKRAAQIRALGITSVEDLAKESANDLAAKLNISPKITAKWIESAKGIEQKR